MYSGFALARCATFVLASLVSLAQPAVAEGLAPDYLDPFEGKPRLFVLTDIGNEPDDQMSFVRLLLYSNELDLEGLVATTSTWQKEKVLPETLRALIRCCGAVGT